MLRIGRLKLDLGSVAHAVYPAPTLQQYQAYRTYFAYQCKFI